MKNSSVSMGVMGSIVSVEDTVVVDVDPWVSIREVEGMGRR